MALVVCDLGWRQVGPQLVGPAISGSVCVAIAMVETYPTGPSQGHGIAQERHDGVQGWDCKDGVKNNGRTQQEKQTHNLLQCTD